MAAPEVAFTALDRDTAERLQTLRRHLGMSSFGLNLLALQPGHRGRIHPHEHQEEVYLVPGGELTLAIEEVDALGPDQLARVGPAVRRALTNAGSGRVVLLALGGSGAHAGRDGLAWPSWEDTAPGRPALEVPLRNDLPA